MPLNAEAPPPLDERLKDTARKARIMIVAGEASGDLHGGDLAREILARDPSCELFGIAGEKMRAAGVRAIIKMEDIHGLGLSELASTIGRTVGAFRTLRRIIRREKPDLLILIDYAEFNLILSGTARRNRVPVLYYITPQVWAWRRGRVDKLVDRADRLAVVLPFEAELFHRAGERVSFVGHPLLDRIATVAKSGGDAEAPRIPAARANHFDPAGQPPRRSSLPAGSDGQSRANCRARSQS